MDERTQISYTPLPTLKRFHESSATHRCMVGPFGCLSGDTEFLARYGWKRIDRWDGEDVAQWDCESGTIEFVSPAYLCFKCDEFIWFKNKHSLSMVVSDEHRMPLYDWNGDFVVKAAVDVEKAPSKHTVPTTFRVNSKGVPYSYDEIRLAVALHADGHSPEKDTHQIRFHLRKERKQARLRELLRKLNIEWSEHVYKGRPTEVIFKFHWWYREKTFNGWWGANSDQLSVIIDEVRYWDGIGRGDEDVRFFTTNKKDAEFIQFASHATGRRATISRVDESKRNENWKDAYIVHIAEDSFKSKVMIRSDTTEIERVPSADGKKYCFNVPSSFFVARHNGRIFITGNSGKTSAAILEFGYYLPMFIYNNYGFKRTRWLILRNTYREIFDTVQQPMFEDWIPWGVHNQKHDTYKFGYPNGVNVEFLFRACDRPDHARQFKSLLITGAWLEESIEIGESVKQIIKGRIGRYPKQKKGEEISLKYLIESTNPPDVDHPLYSQYKWIVAPPEVSPTKLPLEDHEGFWQPPYENVANLPPGYYEDLKKVYRDSPEFADMYILSKPGAMVKGKVVYYDFTKERHVAKISLIWHKGHLYRGWDNTGNSPACVVCQMVGQDKVQVLREYYSDRMNIMDFAEWVVVDCNERFPGAEYTDYADPAGDNKISSPLGGFTSNAKMMQDYGISVLPSDQNWEARRGAVQGQIRKDQGLFIDPSCTRLINGFISGYAFPEIGNTGVYKDRPMKNRFSHVHDALQYLLVKIFRSVAGKQNAIKMARMQRDYIAQHDVIGI